MADQPVTIHPSVATYLGQLSRLLTELEPAERAEVIEGIREHIDSRLEGTAGTEADVRAALAAVGSAEDVADEAFAGRPRTALPPVRGPVTLRAWMPAVVAAFEAVAVLVILVTIGDIGAWTTSASTPESVAGATTTITQTHFDGSVGGGILAFFAALPFWLVVVVLVAFSALWRGREKVVLLAVAPVSALAFAVLPELGYWVLDVNGVYAGAWLSMALAVVGGGAVIWVLTRRAHRRATGGPSW